MTAKDRNEKDVNKIETMARRFGKTLKEKKAEETFEKVKNIEIETKRSNVKSRIEEIEKVRREEELGKKTATNGQLEQIEKERRMRKYEKNGQKKESVGITAQNPEKLKLKRKKMNEGGIGGISKVGDKGGSGANFAAKINNFSNIFSGRDGTKKLAELSGLTWEPSGGGGGKFRKAKESCGDEMKGKN